MKISRNLLTITLLLFMGCNLHHKSNNQINNEILTIDLDNKTFEECSYSQFFEGINIVPLEITKESMLGYVNGIISYKNYFFILDFRVAKGVYQFTHKGRFIRKFGNYGKGPGEYVMPYSFTINKANDEVLILDTSSKRINIYSITGNFSKSISIKSFTRIIGIASVGKYIYLFNNGNQNHLINVINYNGKELKPLLKYDSEARIKIQQGKNMFFQNNDNLFFCQPYLYDIYQIKKMQIIPIIQFQSNTILTKDDVIELNLKLKKANTGKQVNLLKSINCHWGINSYVENDFIWSCMMRTSPTVLLGFKNLKKSSVIEVTKDDMTFIRAPFVATTKNALVSVVNPYFKNKIIKGIKSGKIHVEEKKETIIEKIKTENPVLVLYKLKKQLCVEH